jgi:hypothetical protein
MPDDTATATPDTSTERRFTIPVRNPAAEAKTFKIPVHGKQFTVPVRQHAEPAPATDNEPGAGLKIHPEASVEAWEPTWWQRIRASVTNSQPFHTLETYAPGVASALHLTPTDRAGTSEYEEHKSQLVAGEYLTQGLTRKSVQQTEQFLSLGLPVPAPPKGEFRESITDKPTAAEKVLTGVTKGVAGFTTPEMMALQVIPVGDVLGLGGGLARMVLPRLVTAGFGLSMAKSLVDQWKERQKAKDAGDENSAHEIEGEMSVTALMLLFMGHSATQDTFEAVRNRGTTTEFNRASQKFYKTDYANLTDPQKAAVLYNVAADVNPQVKARIDREATRLAKVAKQSGLPSIEEIADETLRQRAAFEQRAQAAKNLAQQYLLRQQREQAFKADALARERQAREALSLEQQRGFPVEESRTAENLPVTGLRMTTEREPGQRYEPEPAEPAIPITERRAAAGETVPERTAPVIAAEARVQELTEAHFGQSFTTLPIYRQKVAAEWLAKNHPEQWEAFKGTPAYAQHESNVRYTEAADAMIRQYLDRNQTGDREPLAPDADIHAGAAKLILNRSNIDSVLKADPSTHRDLNENTERVMGKSFDSLAPEQRVEALAEYLRAKPDKLKAFLSIDITDRMESGQHIDLANMAAEQMARQRAELRMSQRDSVRRAMEMDLATQVVTEQRTAHDKELSDALYASLTGRTPSLEELYRVSRGITDQANQLGLGRVNGAEDLFKIERDARALPDAARTPAINEFLVRMRQVRAAAEDHVLRELAEKTAAQFRVDVDTATDDAARQIIDLSARAQDLQQAADDLRAQGQTAASESAQNDANFNSRKADAVASGAESVHSPAPTPVAKPDVPMAVGRETRVVSHGNGESLPAHYVLMEAGDLRTSHMPFTYEEREGYNQKGQPRNYKTSKEAQARVAQVAANPDPDQLLDNGVSATTGPPIVDQRTDVISGNRRALGLLTALRDNAEGFAKYRAELYARAVTFGIDPAEVLKYKNPVLVKMLDKPIDSDIEWSRLGTELNRGPEGGMSDEEQGEAMKRLLTPEFIDRMTGIVDSLPLLDDKRNALTVREAMRYRSAEIAQLLRDAGIISPTKVEEYVAGDGTLKEKAKNLFENMLTSLTVTDPQVLNEASRETKGKLARVGMFFAKMQAAGENWNLASFNTDAVRFLNRVQDAAERLTHLVPRAASQVTDQSLVDKFLHPENYVDSKGFGPARTFEFDGQPLVAPPHPAVEALARALEESPRTYATMMAKFAKSAEETQGTLYGSEHPADAFTSEIASKYGLKVLPEEWATVAPLPDVIKAAIEDSRGPLPVEPPVHAETVIADVTPDSSSVTDVLPEGPRTVGELRVALVNHPNIDVKEADALTEVFENILPRATGESLADILGNRRLSLEIGGKEGKARGYTEIIEDGKAIIRLCDTADTSTFLHEMAHRIRRYLKPEYQRVANEFVGAKPGEEWTEAQEEKFAQAFERYHFDGGLRRGKLEAVFSTLHRAMQSIYNAVKGRGLAKGSKELDAMFDEWYDWSRAERKPITAKNDVDELEHLASGKVEIPVDARLIERGGRPVSDRAENFVFLGKDSALDFVRNRKNGVRGYEMHQVRGKDEVYVRADTKKGKKLYQPGLDQMVTLARRAKDLEDQLKKETDPKRQALLRGQLNGIEDKLRGATGIIGATPEPRDTSVIQLVHGVSEQPRMDEPTTPAQAVTVQQIHGDPTGVALGGEHGVKGGTAADEPVGIPEAGAVGGVSEQPGAADREHGAGKGKGTPIAKPDKHPLAGVKAAKLKAPERDRGTPVVDPGKWREHVEALGWPEGTPPPTVRIDPDMREILSVYPGHPEAVEGVLSALQQHDATVLAAPLGSGKCLGRGTPVLMFDGTIMPVEDVAVGDLLMGPDSKPRKVLSLARGRDEMFKVTPVKGDPYIVNRPHILSLKFSEDGKGRKKRGGDVVNISVDNWLKASRTFKGQHKGWRTGVEFEPQEVTIPPYLLGIWLGDGSSNRLSVCKPDKEIRDYLQGIADKFGLYLDNKEPAEKCPIWALTGDGKKNGNPLWAHFVRYGLKNNKHVPHVYKANSVEVRREVLAGLIDTDGHIDCGGCDIIFKERRLAEDATFLARSLGLAAYMKEVTKTCTNNGVSGQYWRISISGDLSEIPMKIARKKAAKRLQKKSVLITGISVEFVGVDDYFGFEIDGDRLFMLGDFTVTHNTVLNSVIASHLLGNSGDKVGLIVTRSQNLVHGADGYIEWGHRVGLTIDPLPSNMAEVQTGGVYAGTYAQIRGNRGAFAIPWDFVIFDESAEARNWTESDQGRAAVLMGHAAKKVVYSSATPYSTIMEMGYMHKLGLWPKGGFAEWASQFGLREIAPNTYSGGTSAKRLTKLRQQLIERGQWQTLYKDMDGVEGHVALIPQTEEVRAGVRNIRSAFAKAAKAFQKAGLSRYLTPTLGHEAIYLKRYIAGTKVPEAIELGKKLIAEGWSPIMFTEYRSPADEGMDFFNNLPGDLGPEINKMLPPLPDVVGMMREAFGDKVGIFAGEANQLRAGELEAFQSGEKDAIYMTYGAGAVGANAQDKVGDRPRAAIFIDLPWGGMMFEQGTGRPWRYGSKSNVSMFFLTTDALPEMKLLATKILPRMRSLKAAVYGEKMESSLAKNLREAVGIPEEVLEYDEGQEVKPQAAEWEQKGEGVNYTKLEDLELPDAKKAKNKGMKYKGQGRKLYQGPTDITTSVQNEEGFKEWFAGSKIVDGTGKPLQLYHGTNAEFEDFAPWKRESGEPFRPDVGFFFTGDPDRAGAYAGQVTGSHIRPVFLDIKNPKRLQKDSKESPAMLTVREISKIKKEGYDGVIWKGEDSRDDEYVAFRPEQIKPAFGRKLYQGPKDEDPWEQAAREAWDELIGKTRNLPAPEAHAISANAPIVQPEIAESAQRSMGSGEPVERVAKRKTLDFINDSRLSDETLLAVYRGKGSARALHKFVQETGWMTLTSGDKVVEKAFRRAGMEKQGIEMKRRMIDFDMRKGLHQGRMQAIIRNIINGNNLKPPDVELMSRVVEGQATTDDPRITKAVKEFRAFTSDIRRALGDAGSAVVIYEDGLRREIPYSAIEDDPHYWPRMYDRQKPFVITDKTTGKKEVHSLAEIMNMPTADERREKIIDQFADERGISKVAARQFFERNDRGIRLAGNVERSREWNIPLYGRDREAIERYIDQVATTLAATEVHGQFRQKTDPIISQLPAQDAALAHRIVTYDLDPAHLPEADRAFLSTSSAFIITGKMFYSPIKVLTHLWKASLATNTRSLIGGLFTGITHPTELFERARDCNALLDYSKSLWMREYGMRRGNIGQKFLDFTGFTFEIQASRVLSSAMGRHWFEKYAYPELVKDPKNPVLRRKLTDLYGMSDEQLDNIAKNGYGPDDVRRIELGAANWVTGSNRPSEMPPMFRPKKDADPIDYHFSTLWRSTQMLHGFMFKTANLVKRTVFDELYRSNWKSVEPYHLVARFAFNAGLAGFALEQLLTLRHKLQHSSEAEIEQHRHEWLEQHPASAEALWWSMANMSMAIGVQPLADLFNELATRNPKDREKLATQHRFAKGVMGMPLGIPGQDADAIFTASEDLANSFSDTGKHKLSPEERRANIIKRLVGEEVVGAGLIPGMKPTPVQPQHSARRHAKSPLQ